MPPVTLDPWLSALAMILAGVGPLLAALAAYYAAKARAETARTHDLVNHRMDELLELTRAAARAQGRLEGPDANPQPPPV
jgi:hypothetical protein